MTTNNCATITWVINNFPYCFQKNEEAIVSPAFCINMPEETKWKLLLFPRGVAFESTFISLFLYRDKDCSGPDEIEVEYNVDIIRRDGSSVFDLPDTDKFQKDMRNGQPRFIHRIIVTTYSPEKYLPQDSLTIRCKIFHCDGEAVKKQQIFARTVIGFEKQFFRWKIDDFVTNPCDQYWTFLIKSETKGARIQVNLVLPGENEETILCGIDLLDVCVKYSAVKTFVIDSLEQEVGSGEYEYWFDSGKGRMFPLKLTKSELMENRSFYLPNAALTLSFELVVSTGFTFEGIEKAACQRNPFSIEVIEDCQKSNTHKKITDCPCALITDFDSLHKDQSTCDIKLQTKSDVFPVNTLILSARSPVFKAIFSNEMKEKTNGIVDVSDLHDDTVRRFLVYLYSDQLGDIKWDDAVELYEVANKYIVNSLKNKCCIYFKNNLTLENACKALIFSDLHQERELKELVQTFMLKNAKVIFKSEEWKKLAENDVKLALKTTLRNWHDD